ncbi:MAG: VOC family protein [Anaerolineae bacterium]|nr:VOC family protein [Anaerolineae bacterium]
MAFETKFVHTNIVARNWQNLAKFYREVFGCAPVLPERDLSGQWLEDCTGVPGAKIQGVHLRLPGYGDEGPTLEIFQYNQAQERPKTAINRPGFAHLAFAVDNVEAAQQAVLAAGGSTYGQRVTVEIPGAGQITVVYVTDPEGNIIELQRWS